MSLNIKNETAARSEKATRLRQLRRKMSLTTEELAHLLGYTRQTISYWENTVEGGISKKGAAKLSEVAKAHGIYCEIGWILHGIGGLDFAIKNLNKVTYSPVPYVQSHIKKIQYLSRFFREIEQFLLENSDVAIFEVKDSSMIPTYQKGDWVGGVFVKADEAIDNKICIVEIEKKYDLRLIKYDKLKNTFTAYFLNDNFKKPEFLDIEILKVAPVLRLWRCEI